MTQDQTDPLLVTLLTLERQVWEALRRGDAAADAALLSADFLGVYPSGFAGRADHAEQLEDGPSVAGYRLTEARCLPVGEAHAMLCYRAEYRRPGQAEEEAMYVSSLWQREAAGWRNIFSQDTPVSDAVLP
ncbi:nuclear transport factor 2 family protein [Roseovarius faecimaris]|uniref:Nuclear transport factor 2 family protein n=1 Tax=Roseovarius faecimaris TaxID=2494550 RepID=A0A6I6IQ03_9RHOB|nr:nuclear transport factor 2 family protein [Roseovarius faecimaris]QGX98214.1 nuclear transport factor 2 family protein [Roseovarius faecimaris]